MKRIIRLFSCIVCLLALFAGTIPAAPAETGNTAEQGTSDEKAELTYAQRLEKAREKYNENTIHIYRSGIGSKQKDKINICLYRSKSHKYYNARIVDSTQITDEAEMEAILETASRDKNFHMEIYGTMANLKAQWIAHNIAHSMATGSEESQKLVELMVGESISSIVGRSKDLDISPAEFTPAREKLLYSMIEIVYGLDHD